jgi:hypothetical protein
VTDATRYPLAWPLGWPRKSATQRARARFTKKSHAGFYPSGGSYTRNNSLTVPQGLDRLKQEIERLGAHDTIISTNVELNSGT